ncbi:restriction endonuclease subunit S [Bifidobacterium longum]|uniref:Type I restriction modification DNA specificity domain protein n=2 Tax=Bifidobacterium longum TaxID=216816 RepID=A0AAV3FL88_BIFLL|nr:type I restriction modification DNA specificity domain protein [Bifidobacterium longum subsp. longum 2-2B]EIJ25122.1 type I restriction modification DNA specificity domain protein [Bifidobacterium longum subsp. longum 35B]QLE15688.1 restriction endonuclease subunit S [Bifidobacterium longum subsp. longum]
MTEQAKVPAIRFAGFTDPWEQRKLGEIVSIGAGAPPSAFSAGNFLYVKVDDLNESSHFQFDSAQRVDANTAVKPIRKGSIIFAKRGAAILGNKVRVLGKTAYIDTNMMALEPRGVDADFLWLFINQTGLYRIADTSTIPQINNKHIEPYPVDIPNMAEQQAIGTFFSRLDDLITLHQRKYDKLVIFKKSMLEKMFPKDGESVPEIRFAGFTDPWEQRKLGELALTYSGGTPSAGNSAYYGGEIPFIRSAEIDCDSTELSLTVAGLNNSSAKLVDKGMVLYAMYGATSGEVAISKIKGAINQAILAMDASDMAANRFIAYWLRRQKKSITETFLQGGQGNLSGAIIKELGIPQPSLDEQRQIGSFFSNLDDLITLHQRKLELLQDIKKSLLDKMFV